MKTLIKLAKIEDIDKLIEIYSEWKKFKGILPDKLIEDETYDNLVKYFDNSTNTRKYFIASNEKNISTGACYIDTSFISLGVIRLGDIIVKEKYRNNGVGSKLIEEIIKFAKKNKVNKIWLWTPEKLTPAIEFYKKRGFVQEGIQKNQFCNKDALLFGLIIKY